MPADLVEEGRHNSFNVIARQVSFNSPSAREVIKRLSSTDRVRQAAAIKPNKIDEEDSEGDEDEEEKSDATSSDDGSSDSSIEAMINGDDETEESLYAKIQANNQEMETGEKSKKVPPSQ